MLTPTDVIEFFKAAIWPVTLLILVYAFRKVIRETFLTRLKGVKLGPGELEFMPPSERHVGEVQGVNKEDALKTIEWERSGALFWFTSDTLDAYNYARVWRERIDFYEMIARSLHHARQLKLDEAILSELKIMRDEALEKREEAWTPEERDKVTDSIRRIFNTVASIAQDHETKAAPTPFKPDPD